MNGGYFVLQILIYIEMEYHSIMKKLAKVYLAGSTGEVDYRRYCHMKWSEQFDLLDPLIISARILGTERQAGIIKNPEMITDSDISTIVLSDKEAIKKCDVFVAYVDKITFGTVMEIMYAYENDKNVYVINPAMNFTRDPWLYFHSDYIFPTIDECFERIQFLMEK